MCAGALSVGSYRHNASNGICFAHRRASRREFPPPSLLARRSTSGAGIAPIQQEQDRRCGGHSPIGTSFLMYIETTSLLTCT
jgi:hypothetical protein